MSYIHVPTYFISVSVVIQCDNFVTSVAQYHCNKRILLIALYALVWAEIDGQWPFADDHENANTEPRSAGRVLRKVINIYELDVEELKDERHRIHIFVSVQIISQGSNKNGDVTVCQQSITQWIVSTNKFFFNERLPIEGETFVGRNILWDHSTVDYELLT